MTWINVKDHLPREDEYDQVLVDVIVSEIIGFCDKEENKPYMYQERITDAWYDHKKNLWMYTNKYSIPIEIDGRVVTYWMYIPDFPDPE